MALVPILSVAVAAMGLYVFFVEPLWVLPVLEWLTPNIVYRVKIDKPLVALSFDDGPHAEFTPRVLEILERHEAKATFFLIGERVLRHPELVARIRAEGHEIGNHYFKDGPTLGHSNERFVEKLEETERAIRAASPEDSGELVKSGVEPPHSREEQDPGSNSEPGAPKTIRLFRAPGGVAWPGQLQLARERGYACVLGCAYPHDPMRPPMQYIRWLITKNLRPGTIVILHDGIKDATRGIAALPDILEKGKRKGLSFVSIGTLVDEADQESH